MTYELIEGFDLIGDNDDLVRRGFSSANGTILSNEGRFGGTAYGFDTQDSPLTLTLLHTEFISVAMWVKRRSGTNFDINILQAYSDWGYGDDTVLPTIQIWSNGQMGILAVDADFPDPWFLDTTSVVVQAETWHLLEIQIKIAKKGRGTVYIDGNVVLDLEANYFFDGFINYTFISIGGSVNNNVNFLVDDIVIQTSNTAMPPLLGNHRIHTLLPNSNTAVADWTGSYTDINDPIFTGSDGDTSYIESGTVNAKSEFGFEDLPVIPDSIHAIQTVVESRKDSTGRITSYHYITSGSSTLSFNEYGPKQTYTSNIYIMNENPDINFAWDTPAVNNVNVGVTIK